MFVRRVGAISALMVYCLVFFAFGTMFAKPLSASPRHVERPEEELLIFELHINDTLRSRGLIGYLPEGAQLSDALLPISALSRAMSVAIAANPMEGTVDGWFIEEKNIFQLDLNRGVVFVNGSEERLEDGEAEAHLEDVYVRISSMEKWFGISITPDIGTLRLFVKSTTLFPFQEELLRLAHANKNKKKSYREPIPFSSETVLPYQWWSNPSVVWQNSLQARRDQSDSSLTSAVTLQAYGDVGKFDTRLLIAGTAGSGQDTDITNAQLSFQKRDPDNNLLGPLNAGKITIGDISYPDVPLFSGRKRGRGIEISSESDLGVSKSFGAETYNVDGDAPLGWDAELYRNGYFVAFQEVDDNGRYDFENVELVRGFNLLQIILYGPEGQKITETQRVIRGQKMLQEGQVEYDIAVGQPESDFLPVARNSRDDTAFGGSGSVSYGIKNYLTVSGSVFTGSDENISDTKDRLSAANVSAIVSYLGLKTQVQYMRATEGLSGYEVNTTTQISGANISVDHQSFQGVEEAGRDLKSSSGAEITKNFGVVSASLRGERRQYARRESEDSIRGNISTNIAGLRISNSVERTYSEDAAFDEFDGDLSILADIKSWRVRANLDYSLDKNVRDKLETLSVTATNKLSDKSTLRLNTTYDFPANITTATTRYSKKFDAYSLDFNLGATNNNSYFGGVTFRTGLQPDHEGNYRMVSARHAGMGAVALRAFLDENENLQYDVGEELLQGVSFRTNRGLLDGKTDENGSLFANGLSESITRFFLDDSSLPSIYLKPYDDHVDIIPRAGATTTIDIGFKRLGEIDGFVFIEKEGHEEELPGVEVVLIDIETGKEVSAITTEYDGYYVFTALELGKYEVMVLPLWDLNEDASVRRIVSVTSEDSVLTDINLTLPELVIPEAVKNETLPVNVEPAAGSPAAKVKHIIYDVPLPVETDGIDLATDQPLRGLFIHIGSMQNFDNAQGEQERLWKKYEDVLGDLPLYIYKVKIGSKTFYRIVAMVSEVSQGNEVCGHLIDRQSAGGCTLVRI